MDPRVLVGVDGSAGATRALEWAIFEAELRQTGVLALNACPSPVDFGEGLFYRNDSAKAAERAFDILSSSITEVTGDHHALNIRPLVLDGDAAALLCERAAEVDLLVVGSRGHGAFAGILLGSVSMKCAHHSPVPVVIVPRHFQELSGAAANADPRIVVGVDGSPGSRRALSWAANEAFYHDAVLQAVTVWPSADDDLGYELRSFPLRGEGELADFARERIEQDVASISELYPNVKIELLALEGDPSETLCQEADDADLLVVGARGHSAFADLLLGSVSTKCAHRSLRPVAIIPGERGPFNEI